MLKTISGSRRPLRYVFAATAVTIDLRHEFIDGGKSDKSNADRVSVSHRFCQRLRLYRRGQMAFGGDNGSQPYSDVVGNGHEDTISWRWKATSNLFLTPGLPFESNDSRSIYKPHLHAQYSFDNGFMSPLAIAMNTPAIRTTPAKMMTKLTAATRGPDLSSATGVQS
ncbi:hypothetical protein LNP74_06900 [Klebsiella pneumoniae subsp. pneumoniae]|nr:hypothetical protein [Klebsiella pneumoniae subsp. pneumoniae]